MGPLPAVSQNPQVDATGALSRAGTGGGQSAVAPTSHWPQGAGLVGPPRCCLAWAPGDGVWCFSPCTATVSAWRPDALCPPPRTSPGSVGVSRPRRQLSSKDPSSKSRSFTCFLTGMRKVVQLRIPLGGSGGPRGLGLGLGVGMMAGGVPPVCQVGHGAFLKEGHIVARSADPGPPGFKSWLHCLLAVGPQQVSL